MRNHYEPGGKMEEVAAGASSEQPQVDESADEREIFDLAVEEAMQTPGIAGVIADFFSVEEVTDHISRHRDEIWSVVSEQRERVRTAKSGLEQVEADLVQQADADVRKSQPELAARYDELAEREEQLTARSRDFSREINEARITKDSRPAVEAAPLFEQVIGKLEEIIPLETSWLSERTNPATWYSPPRKVASHRRRWFQRPAWTQRHRSRPVSADDLNYRYQQALELLSEFRRLVAEFATQRKRVELQMNAMRPSVSDDEQLSAAEATANAASAALATALVRKAVLPEIRRFLNTRTSQIYNLRTRVREADGLYDSLAQPVPIVTPVIDRIAAILERMAGVSIGLAGPRGAGKTTAIEYLCNKASSEQRRIGMVIAAPVEYATRDFILHIYAELCRKIVGPDAEEQITPVPVRAESKEGRNRRIRTYLFVPALGIAGIVVGMSLAVLAASGRPSLARWSAIFIALSGGLIAVYVAISQRGRPFRLRRRIVTTIGPIFGAGAALASLYFTPLRPTLFLGGCAALIAASMTPFSGDYLSSRRNVLVSYLVGIALAFGAVGSIAISYVAIAWDIYLFLSAVFILLGIVILGGFISISRLPFYRTLRTSPIYEQDTADTKATPIAIGPDAASPKFDNDLATLALENLRGIRYQQTFSVDRSQGLTVSAQPIFDYEVERKLGASWAREPRGLPEIVARFREFITDVGQRYQIVIGIDELDKLSAERAERFLNDIKAIFGIRGCHFLVSVSEEAAAGFERRGVPFRDVFDSCFDDVITVGYMDSKTSAYVLDSRIVGLSRPFVWLCHVLSGGLARDLIRVARTLLMAPNATEESLAQSAQRLCREELASKTRGICDELARMQYNESAADLLVHILGYEELVTTAESHLSRSEDLRSWIEERKGALSDQGDNSGWAILRHANELVSFAYFTGTVCEFFGESLTEKRLADALANAGGPRSIERLATARQTMTVSAMMAQRYVSEFRRAWNLMVP